MKHFAAIPYLWYIAIPRPPAAAAFGLSVVPPGPARGRNWFNMEHWGVSLRAVQGMVGWCSDVACLLLFEVHRAHFFEPGDKP